MAPSKAMVLNTPNQSLETHTAQVESKRTAASSASISRKRKAVRNNHALVPYSSSSTTSHAMSKSNSNAASAAAKDSGDAANPYGTRSRNRPRPNYAEDTPDMDFEYSTESHKKSSRQRNSSPQVASDSSTPARSSSNRKSTGANGDGRNLVQQTLNDHLVSTPGAGSHSATSSTSGNGATTGNDTKSSTQPPSKKRKTGHSNNNGSSNSSSHSNGSNGSKRSHAAAASRGSPSTSTLVVHHTRYTENNLMSFTNCGAMLNEDGALVADDGTVLLPNDHVYLVSEPPGEPYYLGRIMEFMHVGNDISRPVDAIRVNWYYRPKDIGKRVQDTRLLLATMHSDVSPLSTVRGKCRIMHKSEISSLEEYKKVPDSFWYEKLYDRYIQKHYDLVPTSSIINVPEKVKRMLDEHWKFILVEQGRGRELTAAVKLCKRCNGYCASNDSVDCSDCKITWHMNCVNPPVTKKPSRGFGWSCAPCSRRHEKMINARHTPVFGNTPEVDEDDFAEEEEEFAAAAEKAKKTPPVEEDTRPEPTPEQIQHASLWPFRYLGAHCNVEDALDLDDRIYPRTSTRIGPRHQATVMPWPGRPVEYEKPLELKKPGRREPRLTKEQIAEFEAKKAERENRPAWRQDEPPGYTVRGEDYDNDDSRHTATLLWKMPDESVVKPEKITSYMKDALELIKEIGVPKLSTNLQDIALNALFTENFDTKAALEKTRNTNLAEFKEPALSPSELKRFEEGVAKFGSELGAVSRHVKTVPHKDIVRFYYTWKKTNRGKEVWGNFQGRKSKKEAKAAAKSAAKLQDDIADDADDSAYDNEKAIKQKRLFTCKFCNTKKSRQWRRAPNGGSTEGKTVKEKNNHYVVALCRRCAELWRRYAVQWEDIDDIARKIAQSGGRAWKRKQDEELIKEIAAAKERFSPDLPAVTNNGSVQKGHTATVTEQPPRKKLKTAAGEKSQEISSAPVSSKKKERELQREREREQREKEKEKEKEREAKEKEKEEKAREKEAKEREKEKEKELQKEREKTTPVPSEKTPIMVATTPVPAVVPELPKPRPQPCAVCGDIDDSILTCKDCRLPVHAACYGVKLLKSFRAGKWSCDTCMNDRNPQLSLDYHCVLCPIDSTVYDWVGIPEKSGRKKDKERDRVERELAKKTAEFYQKKQEESGRPANPHEALKRTADNNWVHVTCAVMMNEIMFGNTEALAPAEGVTSIPRARFERICSICKQSMGACVECDNCPQTFHIECARRRPNRYFVGFAMNSVKSTRRAHHKMVTCNGESGEMSPTVFCLSHDSPSPAAIGLHDAVKEHDLTALQLYVRNYKQADLTLTGSVRKAGMIASAAKTGINSHGRRGSTATPASPISNGRSKLNGVNGLSDSHHTRNGMSTLDQICIACGIDVSPRWWPLDESIDVIMTDADQPELDVGDEAKRFVDQRKFRCHKCHKLNKMPQKRAPDPIIEAPILHPVPPPAPIPAPPSSAMPQDVYPVAAVTAPLERPPPLASPRIAPPPPQPAPPMDHRPYQPQPWLSTAAPVHRPAPASPPSNGPMSRNDRPYYQMAMPPFSNGWDQEYRSAQSHDHRIEPLRHNEPPMHRVDHHRTEPRRSDSLHRPASISESMSMHSRGYPEPVPPPQPQPAITLTQLRPPPLPISSQNPQQAPPMSHAPSHHSPHAPVYSHSPSHSSLPSSGSSYHQPYSHNPAPAPASVSHHHHHHTHHTHHSHGPHSSHASHSGHSHHQGSHPHHSSSHSSISHSHSQPSHPGHSSLSHHHSPHNSMSGSRRSDLINMMPQHTPRPAYPSHAGSPLTTRDAYGHYGRDRPVSQTGPPSVMAPGPSALSQRDTLGPRPPSAHGSAPASISPSLKNLLS